MLVSNCCGRPVVGNSDDYGLCPECKDHCEYIDDEIEDLKQSGHFTAINDMTDTKNPKTRTPRDRHAIYGGAIKLPLAERVALLKALQENIQAEVTSLQAQADEAAKLVKS